MDTREQILNRMHQVALAASGFTTKVRNRGLLTTDKRPVIMLLDGDETPAIVHGGRGRTQALLPLVPQVMEMRPELWMVLKEAGNSTTEQEALGTQLNVHRVNVVRAMAEDAPLLSLLGPNGGMVYQGCQTDLKSGASLKGQMRLDFALRYTFFPTTNQQGVS